MKLGETEELLSMTILVVDDEPMFLELLKTLLTVRGFKRVLTANSTVEAFKVLEKSDPAVDLILSDVNMPEHSGHELLRLVKSHKEFRHIPVIMISGMGRFDAVIRCIKSGADDFLGKPVEKELLWARVISSLERKLLRDKEHDLLLRLDEAKERTEALLYSVMPRRIAKRLQEGENFIAERLENVSVLFADMVGFTPFAKNKPPEHLVNILNELFMFMDRLAEEFDLEKIKTIGDNYMLAGGINPRQEDHAERCVQFARASIEGLNRLRYFQELGITMRVGIHSGTLVGGIIGNKRPMFDLWGETVNLASRMESHGIPNRIQVSPSTFQQLPNEYGFKLRGEIDVKGAGIMRTYISPVYVDEEKDVPKQAMA